MPPEPAQNPARGMWNYAPRQRQDRRRKGELYFTCYRGSFTGPVFLAFLQRLVRQANRKIHLIVDPTPGAPQGQRPGLAHGTR